MAIAMMTAPMPGTRLRAAGLGLLLIFAGMLWTAQAMAFECPTPQPLSHPGVIRETSAQTRQLEAVLASGDASNHLPILVEDLRRRYPWVENAEIRNYLITAYCPAIAELSGLDDAEKLAQISDFESEIIGAIQAAARIDRYKPKNGEDASN